LTAVATSPATSRFCFYCVFRFRFEKEVRKENRRPPQKVRQAETVSFSLFFSFPLSSSSSYQRPLRRLRQLVPQVHSQQRGNHAQTQLDPPDVIKIVDVSEDERFERRGGHDRDERGDQDADTLHGKN